MLGNAIHADGKGPHLSDGQIVLEALHEVVRLGHPLENVDSRANNHGVISLDGGHIGRRKTVDSDATRFDALGDGVGDLIRRPVL